MAKVADNEENVEGQCTIDKRGQNKHSDKSEHQTT